MLSCLAALTVSGGVRAQQPTITLDTVVVEGEGERARGPVRGLAAETSAAAKTSTPLVETPQSISVIGREQIELIQPKSVLEAVRYAPGVTDSSGGSDMRTDLFQIRGFNASPTGLYLDGLQLPSPNFAVFRLEPFGLERFEILRGPASVLYGGGGPGGLINAVSKRPLFENHRYVEAGVNGHGNVYGAFDIGGPVAWGAPVTPDSGTLAYRVVGLGRLGDAQVDHSKDERLYIAPSVTWRPNGATSFTVLASYQQDRANSLNFLPYLGTVRPAPFGRIPRELFTAEPSIDVFERRQALIGYEFEHRFSDRISFRQNARYSHVETEYNGIFGSGYAAPPTATDARLIRRTFREQPVLDIASVDNQVEARFETGPLQHTALVGLDYRHVSFLNRSARGFATPLNLLAPVYDGIAPSARTGRSDVTLDQLGLYVQDQIKLGRLSLLLSGRQDFISTELENRLSPAASASGNDSAFTGRAGLIYNFDNGLAPYVSYATSFEPQLTTNAATGNLLNPERGKQYEVGIKYQPPGLDTVITLAAFDLRKQDVAVSDGALGIVQRGEVRSRGVEAEIVAKILDGLKVVGAVTAFDIEITKDSNLALIGKTPPGTIDRMASLYLDYTLQTGGFEGLGVGAGLRYLGKTYADSANLRDVPAVTLADAGIHYKPRNSNFNVSLTAKNLLDKRYVASCASESFCFYGEGRRVTLAVGYRW